MRFEIERAEQFRIWAIQHSSKQWTDERAMAEIAETSAERGPSQIDLESQREIAGPANYMERLRATRVWRWILQHPVLCMLFAAIIAVGCGLIAWRCSGDPAVGFDVATNVHTWLKTLRILFR